MKRTLSILILPLLISACGSTHPDAIQVVDEVRATPDCRIASIRYTQMIGNGSAAPRVADIGESSAPVRATIGEGATGDRGAGAATSLGDLRASGGASGGTRNVGSQGRMTDAVEYRIKTGGTERTIMQRIDTPGDVLPVGAACRIVGVGSASRVTWA